MYKFKWDIFFLKKKSINDFNRANFSNISLKREKIIRDFICISSVSLLNINNSEKKSFFVFPQREIHKTIWYCIYSWNKNEKWFSYTVNIKMDHFWRKTETITSYNHVLNFLLVNRIRFELKGLQFYKWMDASLIAFIA